LVAVGYYFTGEIIFLCPNNKVNSVDMKCEVCLFQRCYSNKTC